VSAQLRVERALRLLPAVEALEPLRMLLLSVAEPDDARRWSSSGPYETVGKRALDLDALRTRVDNLLPRVATHVTTLFNAYVRALQATDAGDGAGAAMALADAGDEERNARRLIQAHAWYEVAFRIASELSDRRPEIDVLARLGDVSLALDRPADAARYFQRLLVLAEAGFDHEGVIRACLGLCHAALARHQNDGARAWCLRGLRQAAGGDYPRRTVQLEQGMAVASWRAGDLDDAWERLARARVQCESLDAPAEMARILLTRGSIERELGKTADAVATLREALAWTRRTPGDPALHVEVAVALAESYVLAGHLVDAERELRSAEQFAIEERATDRLVNVYVAMGRVCAIKKDETGFVFFEQAIELCRLTSASGAIEGRAYEEYGRFRQHFGQLDEAHAHFERGARLFESTNDEVSLQRVKEQLNSVA
jgi:tetratricopeptide (TPR) repeat protein